MKIESVRSLFEIGSINQKLALLF